MIYTRATLWARTTTNPEGASVEGSGSERRSSSANGAEDGSSLIRQRTRGRNRNRNRNRQ